MSDVWPLSAPLAYVFCEVLARAARGIRLRGTNITSGLVNAQGLVGHKPPSLEL